MPDALSDARQLIESRLREVRAELAHLERVLRSLASGDDQTARRSRRSTTPRRRRRATATRTERMNSLVVAARKAPKATNAELAKALGVTRSYISQLLAEGKKTGRLARRNGKLVAGGPKPREAGARRREAKTARASRSSGGTKTAPTRRRSTGARTGRRA